MTAWRECDQCNYDLHVCPVCGDPVGHGETAWDVCRRGEGL